MTADKTLLPCPFCPPEVVMEGPKQFAYSIGTEDEDHIVQCLDCSCIGGGGKTAAESVAKWNRRARITAALRMGAERGYKKACAALEQDEVGAPCGYLRDMTERAETAERQLAELRERHEALVKDVIEWKNFWRNYSSLREEYQDDMAEERNATLDAMSAVALRREGE